MVLKLLTVIPLAVVISICLFRAVFIFKPPPPPVPCSKTPEHQSIKLTDQILARFKGALDIPTISYKAHKYETSNLVRLREFIHDNYPSIHKSNFIELEIVSNYTLLYTINGLNKQLRPYLLTSHLDVVPVVTDKWSSDPFKSVVKDDKHLYARGAIDAKHLLIAILESLEIMLNRGFRPRRSFFLVFGHDEEVGGLEGALAVSKLLPIKLAQNGWDKLEYILDEGNIISKTPVAGIETAVALVGVAEKGYVTMKVSTAGSVGHGSMPTSMTAISKLSKAIGRFHSNLFPSMFGRSVERKMLETFAYHSKWPYKFMYANLWLFNPIFEYIFSSDPPLNSLIRTSTAVTLIEGGTKENVLPDSATAFINHRIHPLQTIADVLEYDKQVINDPSINIEIHGHNNEPTPTSPHDDASFGFQLIKRSVLQVYPNTVVVPSVFLAASDSKWYVNITDSIYRFSAIAVPLEEMNRFHGHDERISLENYENLLNFYHHLITNSDATKLALQTEDVRDEL